jgi:hypothetical protein
MIIPAFFLTPLFKIGATAAVALVLVGSCMLRDASLRKEGATKVVAKIEKANKHAVKKADDVGRKSRDPAARGVRDPYYTPD